MAARALLACDSDLTPELTKAMEAVVHAKRVERHIEELEALHGLDGALPDHPSARLSENGETMRKLVKSAWGYLFQHHYFLKERG